MKQIVVGTDGSSHANKAVAWAAEEAAVHGAALTVIHTFNPIDMSDMFQSVEAMNTAQIDVVRQRMDDIRTDAQTTVDRVVAEVRRDHPSVSVEGQAIDSARPAATLVEHASNADLLVVGSRGRGGFTGLLLGSVSQQCATHATCPVVIVR